MPEVKGLLWDLQRAARAGVDVEDPVVIKQLRLLTGTDPTSETRQSIPGVAVPAWAKVVQEIVRAHQLEDGGLSSSGR